MPKKRTESDGPRMWLVVQPRALVPASEFDQELLERHRLGARLIATLHEPVNEAQHKAYWAMLNEVAKATGIRREALHTDIRLIGGFYEDLVSWGDAVYRTPRSMREMDAAEVNELFRTAERLFAEKGIDLDALRQQSRRRAGLAAPLKA